MRIEHSVGARFLCVLAGVLMVVLPACQQTPRNNPDGVQRLMADKAAPEAREEAFSPVPEEELAAFALPEYEPYKLGKGDTVSVAVVSRSPVSGFEKPFVATVKEDGTIRLPVVGRVDAENKSALELEEILEKPIQEGLVKDAIVSVETTGFASRRFFILGQVGQPGTLPVNGKTTLLEALLAVGGTNVETADLEEAYIIRDQQPIPFSIRDIVMKGHPAGQLVMEENDIVFVPHLADRQNFVYVFGEVAQQTRVALERNSPLSAESSLTLADAIASVGGLNQRANINNITIYRGTWKDAKLYKVGIADLYSYGNQIYLQAGDRIAVGTSASAKFSDAIAPGLQVISATSSALSLAISAIAISK